MSVQYIVCIILIQGTFCKLSVDDTSRGSAMDRDHTPCIVNQDAVKLEWVDTCPDLFLPAPAKSRDGLRSSGSEDRYV